jgi:hypothetical protein
VRRIVKFLLVACAVYVVFRVGQFGWSVARSELWSLALWRQAEQGPGTVVDLAQIGPSGWERVYLFGPYTPHESIHQALGFRWPEADRTSIRSNDGVNLLVFVRGGEVAGWFEHTRNRGDFAEDVARTEGYARDEARFVVQLDSEQRLVLAAR